VDVQLCGQPAELIKLGFIVSNPVNQLKTAVMTTVKTVDEYLSLFPEAQRNVLQQIRETIKQAAPTAEETVSYGMPAYKLNGVLVYFGGFKNHCSFFPAGSSLIKQFSSELKGYNTSKGTIQFQLAEPIPFKLISKMVRERVKQNAAKQKAKSKPKSNTKLTKKAAVH
jgi:uncharacterized protein YdhG (YjbR/CyaY superfamily)